MCSKKSKNLINLLILSFYLVWYQWSVGNEERFGKNYDLYILFHLVWYVPNFRCFGTTVSDIEGKSCACASVLQNENSAQPQLAYVAVSREQWSVCPVYAYAPTDR